VSHDASIDCPSEDSLLSFLNNEADASAIDHIDRHMDQCADCANVIAEFARLEIPIRTLDVEASTESFGSLCRGDTLGRYLVLDLLGQGAMGSVYAAYDNELDRKVALKVLRQSNWAGLVREGRALAALTHPNIVTVHDLGSADSRSFIAMEFIDGLTLRRWMSTKRTWPEVLEIFLEAGDALAAAHAAGIVHRDFKPDNVLIDRGGKAYVADFGLARAVDREDESSQETGLALEASTAPVDPIVTKTGVLLGTPAYMSPEQLRGHGADAYSDQYAFSVALYEALYGERPFVAGNVKELQDIQMASEAKLTGKTPVPSWIGQAVLRGLARDSEYRHRSMDDYLAVLRSDPRKVFWRRLRTVGLVSVMGILGLLAIIGFGGRGESTEKACQSSAGEFADTWGDPAVRAFEARFAEIGTPHAEDVRSRLRDKFDAYSSEWASARDQACADTRIRGIASDDTLERRMHCFERHRREFQVLLTAITEKGGPNDFVAMVKAADALPRSSDCRDVNRPEFRVSLPATDAGRERVRDIESKLVELAPTHWTKMNRDDIALVEGLIAEAEPLSYAPLLARGFFVLHQLYRLHENDDAALAAAHSGIVASTEAKDDRAIAHWMIYFLSRQILFDRPAEEFETTRFFAANAVLRAGNTPELRARLAMVEARHFSVRDTVSKEEALWEEAVQATNGIASLQTLRAKALQGLGKTLIENGRANRGLDYLQEAVDLLATMYGRHSPIVIENRGKVAHGRAQAMGNPNDAIDDLRNWVTLEQARHGKGHRALIVPTYNLAQVLSWSGNFDEAKTHLEAALAITQKQPGNLAETLATMQFELSEIHQGLGHFEAGEQAAQAGLQQLIDGVGQNDSRTTEAYVRVAYAAQGRGNLAKATRLLDTALPALKDASPLMAIYWHWVRGLVAEDANDLAVAETVYAKRNQLQEALGENSLERIDSLVALGDVLRRSGKGAEALAHCQQARSFAKAHTSATDHHSLIAIDGCMGKALLTLGRAGEANPFLEKAVAAHAKRSTRQRPVSVGETHLLYAEELRKTEPAAARAIVAAELQRLSGDYPAAQQLRRRLERRLK